MLADTVSPQGHLHALCCSAAERLKANTHTASAKPLDLIQSSSGHREGAPQTVDFCEHSKHICSCELKHQLPHLEAILSWWKHWPKTSALKGPGINLPVSISARGPEHNVKAPMSSSSVSSKAFRVVPCEEQMSETWPLAGSCVGSVGSHVALALLGLRTEERWEESEGRERSNLSSSR